MQDGKFTQGETTHSVGNAVFVFAGGTAIDMEEFRATASKNKLAKGPDFLSRLQGFLNVYSLDHDENALIVSVLVRRAVLLRSLLLKHVPNIASGTGKAEKHLDIHDSITTAFLCVDKFLHGARSIESILTMSALNGRVRFEPSFLPSREQIALHVDSERWFTLIEDPDSILRKMDSSFPPIAW